MAFNCIQSSSSSRTRNFDVFVSFRGEDTRKGFTDHLFAALQRKGVVAFRDDQIIKKGEFIAPELEQAIEGSFVFIVVFSKNYASSTWCLQELTKIVDWVEVTGRSVLPVFYDVNASEVRKQTGNFGKAFAEHEERFKEDFEMVQRWRGALTAVTNRCGWDVQNKLQHEEIEKIVEEVTSILGHNQILSFEDDLVDMHSRVKQLEELLDLGSNEVVRVGGICGMDGIGKTTLATALFNKISYQYDACCFIDDVSKIYRDSGPTGVQKQLICQALNQGNLEIYNLTQGTKLVRTRLCHLKVLIVLDNVDHVEQLEKLALRAEYLGAGSRIIIISSDVHILRTHGINEVYNVQLLNKDKALQLFCRKALKSDYTVREYEELTYNVLAYANGLPLAIKVLNSLLFGRDVSEWRSALARLRENPSRDIMDVLRISFDGLEEEDKEIFLDIACFFPSGMQKQYVERILHCRGFFPEFGIKVLIDKSLISCKHNVIQMHDLLQELGRNMVREKSPKEPWSRLWDYKDLHNVTIENKTAKNLEAIVIEHCPYEFRETTIRADALSEMNHLKLLILRGVNFSRGLNHLSNELRYLSWDKYPFKYLPSSFQPKNLVELHMPNSSIKRLWKGIKYLPHLRELDLRQSKNLIEIPNLTGVPRLKILILEGCVKMVQIDPSIGDLRELAILNLKNCKKLFLNLNKIFRLESLERLNLSGCSKLFLNQLLKKPRQAEHLENQFQSTSSIYKILTLPFHFSSRKREDSFGKFLPYLSRLSDLDLSFCNLLQIPDAIGSLHSLVSLNLEGNKFMTLPTTIKQLSKLRRLNLQYCRQLKYLPELPSTKEKEIDECFVELYIFDCPNLSEMECCYSRVFSWMIRILEFQVCFQSSLSRGQVRIVIPGTQIPRWFSKQNVGNSISMDPSPAMEDHNWMGVACCAIFGAHDDPTNSGNKWRRHCYSKIECRVLIKGFRGGFCSVWLLFNEDLVTVESDHLLIFFVTRLGFIRLVGTHRMHDIEKMEFTLNTLHAPGLHLEVKNCGYRWVFKEDLQQFNPNMMFGRNSSFGNK